VDASSPLIYRPRWKVCRLFSLHIFFSNLNFHSSSSSLPPHFFTRTIRRTLSVHYPSLSDTIHCRDQRRPLCRPLRPSRTPTQSSPRLPLRPFTTYQSSQSPSRRLALHLRDLRRRLCLGGISEISARTEGWEEGRGCRGQEWRRYRRQIRERGEGLHFPVRVRDEVQELLGGGERVPTAVVWELVSRFGGQGRVWVASMSRL
jgi:hypothetical protein